MADWLTQEQRSRNMASIRSKGNETTEICLAKAMRASQIRGWRRHADLPGKPDFVFRKERVALFVDGCFWHGCPRCYRLPEDNRQYWETKLSHNKSRDRRNSQRLRLNGWRVLRVWEHNLESERGRALVISKIKKALKRPVEAAIVMIPAAGGLFPILAKLAKRRRPGSEVRVRV